MVRKTEDYIPPAEMTVMFPFACSTEVAIMSCLEQVMQHHATLEMDVTKRREAETRIAAWFNGKFGKYAEFREICR